MVKCDECGLVFDKKRGNDGDRCIRCWSFDIVTIKEVGVENGDVPIPCN